MPLDIDSLIHAAEQGDTGAIRRHLKQGGDPNLCDDKGRTALRQATFHGQLRVMRLLLANGASMTGRLRSKRENLLAFADEVGAAKVLIDAGADVNGQDSNGRSPLFHHFDHPKVLRLLLRSEADPNQEDNWCLTPLMFAARDGKLEAVKIMTQYGGRWDQINRRTQKDAGGYATPEVWEWYSCRRR